MCLVSGAPHAPTLSWGGSSFLLFLGLVRVLPRTVAPERGPVVSPAPGNRVNCFYRSPRPGLPHTGQAEPVWCCSLLPGRCALEKVDFYGSWINLIL